jgi:protein-S-isoprenylcysteine O-methyltransferase Ste14
MKTSRNKNSLWNFPPDIFILSGIPLVAVALIMANLFYLTVNNPQFVVWSSLLLAMFGAGLLFWAKLPLFQAGIYLSFGPRAITPSRRDFYYWGMGLALGGCGVAGMLIPLLESR